MKHGRKTISGFAARAGLSRPASSLSWVKAPRLMAVHVRRSVRQTLGAVKGDASRGKCAAASLSNMPRFESGRRLILQERARYETGLIFEPGLTRWYTPLFQSH